MPRFAVIDNGTVIGTLSADVKPTIDIPVGRIFVEIVDGMVLNGGEGYDEKSGVFILPPAIPVEPPVIIIPEIVTLTARVRAIEIMLGIGVIQPPPIT